MKSTILTQRCFLSTVDRVQVFSEFISIVSVSLFLLRPDQNFVIGHPFAFYLLGCFEVYSKNGVHLNQAFFTRMIRKNLLTALILKRWIRLRNFWNEWSLDLCNESRFSFRCSYESLINAAIFYKHVKKKALCITMINSNIFYWTGHSHLSNVYESVFLCSHELDDNGRSNRQQECKQRNSNRGWRITVVSVAANVAGLDHIPDATTGGNILCSTCYTAGTASVNAC